MLVQVPTVAKMSHILSISRDRPYNIYCNNSKFGDSRRKFFCPSPWLRRTRGKNSWKTVTDIRIAIVNADKCKPKVGLHFFLLACWQIQKCRQECKKSCNNADEKFPLWPLNRPRSKNRKALHRSYSCKQNRVYFGNSLVLTLPLLSWQ